MKTSRRLPVMPLRDLVIYPHGVHTLLVATASSIRAVAEAEAASRELLLVARRNPEGAAETARDLHEVGTITTLARAVNLADGAVKILVEGKSRARVEAVENATDHLQARVLPVTEAVLPPDEAKALQTSLIEQVQSHARATGELSDEAVRTLASIRDPGQLVDAIASRIKLPLDERQALLASFSVPERAGQMLGLIDRRRAQNALDKEIRGQVREQMEKHQREHYLNEQLRAIQQELRRLQDAPGEVEKLAEQVQAAGMPAETRDKAIEEVEKLKQMSPMSAEATVLRTWLDWMLKMPWKRRKRQSRDLARAERILDEDHHGLAEVKERVLEYLAVQARVGRVKGPVLCLVGPPGVGKTSLAESIARATNRRFARMALGGVRDEAEIRGHRRTYVGALPGKVMQRLARVGVRNPLFLFDEVDKMGADFRGDPASALLEVLDPEQNSRFSDHYLEADFDLSDVFFLCTANSLDIPPPLLDRMEVVRLPGYTETEKRRIASRYLLPGQRALAGLKASDLGMEDAAIEHLIRHYTREAGVRGLEREIARVVRKVVRRQASGECAGPVTVDVADIERYCGVRKFSVGIAENESQVGVATGLAWTEAGGELLKVEAAATPGKGRQTRTGSLGEVMHESIQAALTFVRSRGEALGIAPDYHEKHDFHVHVPEGAAPKDGPSAGLAVCTALVSLAAAIPARADVAMTGEITLRGRLLRIGGLKEKLLAAQRGGISVVIIPLENEHDLAEISEGILKGLDVRPVACVDEALRLALERLPAPLLSVPTDGKSSLTGSNRLCDSHRHAIQSDSVT